MQIAPGLKKQILTALMVLCNGAVVAATTAQATTRMSVKRELQIKASDVTEDGVRARYEDDFQKIQTTIRRQFYDPRYHGVDWNGVTARRPT